MSRAGVIAALAVFVAIDAWPALPLVPVWKEPPGIYQVVNEKPGVVLAEFPVDENDVFNTPFMYFSLWHWRPLVNGYSGHLPHSYAKVVPDLLAFPRGDTVAALRRWGVTHVTVNCGLPAINCKETMTLMRQSRDLRLIKETRWEGEPVQLYEITAN